MVNQQIGDVKEISAYFFKSEHIELIPSVTDGKN